jgi:hypothetical protein
MTFWVTPGINAEQWNIRPFSGGRVCKVTSPVQVTKTSIAPATDNQIGANWLLQRELVFGTMDLVEQFPAYNELLWFQTG